MTDHAEKSSLNDPCYEGEGFTASHGVMLPWGGGVGQVSFAGWDQVLNGVTLAKPRLLR